MKSPYTFRNLATGRVCCSTDRREMLCPKCAAQAVATHGPAITSAPTVAAGPDVSAPPSLADAIAARRGVAPVAVNDAPIFGNGRRVTAASRPADGVDDPPSLTDAVNARRQR